MYAENHGNTGMNVKHGNVINIVSGVIGRDLIASTAARPQNYCTINRGIWRYSLRHCTVNGERSGGAVVKVTLTKVYGHTPIQPVFTRRLPTGFSERRVIAAVGRGMLEARDAKYIMDLREQVYEAAEASGLSHNDLCLLEDRSPDATATYDDMDETECRFWLKEFAGMSASS
jgi:hypothetical protein